MERFEPIKKKDAKLVPLSRVVRRVHDLSGFPVVLAVLPCIAFVIEAACVGMHVLGSVGTIWYTCVLEYVGFLLSLPGVYGYVWWK